MRYPLQNWNGLRRGYVFGQKTYYNNFHLGVDLICPSGTPIYAPTNGYAKGVYGKQGGNTIHFTNERLIRFMHLSGFGKTGYVKEGEIIGYTGNTGMSSTPHVHIDVSKGKILILQGWNFINPEGYFKPYTPAPAPIPPKTFTVRIDKAQAAHRVSPNSKAKLINIYGRGQTFPAFGTVVGERVYGNNVWYRTAQGYVWSGGLRRI